MKCISLIILSVFFLHGKSIGQIHWQGLGSGDAYLEINDSIITFNASDHFTSTCKIDSITNDSIFCSVYDDYTGEYINAIQFSYSNNFNKISRKINSEVQQFFNINYSDNFKSHFIKSFHYRVYEYEGSLIDEIVVYQDGIAKNGVYMALESPEDTTFQKVQALLKKVSKLDLDNFNEAELFSMGISHSLFLRKKRNKLGIT